jgi:hypothetical protein
MKSIFLWYRKCTTNPGHWTFISVNTVQIFTTDSSKTNFNTIHVPELVFRSSLQPRDFPSKILNFLFSHVCYTSRPSQRQDRGIGLRFTTFLFSVQGYRAAAAAPLAGHMRLLIQDNRSLSSICGSPSHPAVS